MLNVFGFFCMTHNNACVTPLVHKQIQIRKRTCLHVVCVQHVHRMSIFFFFFKCIYFHMYTNSFLDLNPPTQKGCVYLTTVGCLLRADRPISHLQIANCQLRPAAALQRLSHDTGPKRTRTLIPHRETALRGSVAWFITFGSVLKATSTITLKILCTVQYIKYCCALAPKLRLHNFHCHWSNIELGHKGETLEQTKKNFGFNLMLVFLHL